VKVTTQALENCQIEMTIEVEDARVQEALQRTAKQISGSVSIPGFRKGKAPYSVVVRALGGEDALYKEMFKEVGPKWVQEALKETDFTPLRAGEITDFQKTPLSFKVTFAMPPVIELGDYRALRVPYAVPPVPEEDVDKAIDIIRQRNMVVEPAGDGPAEWDHAVSFGISATVGPGNEALGFGSVTDESGNINMMLDQASDPLLPGLAANIVGMKVGEQKTFSLTIPADFAQENLRGQTVTATITLNDLKRVFLPPVDDALAQTVGNFETLAQLRDSLRGSLQQTLAAQYDAGYAEQCIEQLVQAATIEFPPVLIEEELDKLLDEARERLREQKMSLEEFLNIKKQTVEQYREEMKPRAATRLKKGLALSRFVEAENLFPEKADETDGEKMAARALDRLVKICRGESLEPPAAEPAPAAPAA
jgi:trigger factor